MPSPPINCEVYCPITYYLSKNRGWKNRKNREFGTLSSSHQKENTKDVRGVKYQSGQRL
jgi:hypothetical protein